MEEMEERNSDLLTYDEEGFFGLYSRGGVASAAGRMVHTTLTRDHAGPKAKSKDPPISYF